MVAELDSKAETCDQVHKEYSVLFDRIATHDLVKQPHGAHKLKEHEEDAKDDISTDLNRAEHLDGHKNDDET